MINLAATSAGASFGQASTIQGQGSDKVAAGAGPRAATTARGFPSLAGFGAVGEAKGGGGALAASAGSELMGQGFGKAVSAQGGASISDPDLHSASPPTLDDHEPESPQSETPVTPTTEGALAPGFDAPAHPGVSLAGLTETDAQRGFRRPPALNPGSLERTSGASAADGGSRQAQAASGAMLASQAQDQARPQALPGAQGSIATPAASPIRIATDTAALLQMSPAENPPLATGSVRAGMTAVPEWSPVRVDPQQAHWGRDLMAALAERVEMQISQQIKQARIRLDPPDMGRLQLTVRMDGDRLSIQLNASHSQVREALAQQQDRLRADLAGEYGQGVEVSVGQEQSRQRSTAGGERWQSLATGSIVTDGLIDEPVESPAAAAPGDRDWVSALV